MERKIGEIFEHNSDWYQCVESGNCDRCSLSTTECGSGIKSDLAVEVFGNCSKLRRSDNKHAIFKKLKKVGEPYEYFIQGLGITILQEYILANPSYTCDDNKHVFVLDCQNGKVAIELKQNKEDMEEKNDIRPYNEYFSEGTVSNTKHLVTSSLKPFDLEAAKAGKPVCTRDGRKARIICFDKKCLDDQILIALVDCGKEEAIYFYTIDGKCIDDFSSFDLMMLPEKKEGWVNVYKGSVCISVYPRIYKSREEAVSDNTAVNRIDTVKISWEE